MRGRLCLIALCAATSLHAQLEVDSDSEQGRRAAAAFASVWDDSTAGKLTCSVRHFGPSLDYGLRTWAGFNAAVAAAGFVGRDARAAIVLRITPRERPSNVKYLWMPFYPPQTLPPDAKIKNLEFRVGGGFYLGPGRYRVDWLLADSEGARCKSSWNLNARDRGPANPVPAGTIATLGSDAWSGFPPQPAGGKDNRATIFLHAAPVWPRRVLTKLSPWDRQILLSTLNTVLRDAQFTSACVVVFDLERRNVIYRDEAFDRRGMRRLMRQLAAVDLSTIDMKTLREGSNPKAFLEEMLWREVKQPKQSDAFVFVGPTWRAGVKVGAIQPALREAAPPTWFLAFTPRGLPTDGDSVTSLVKSMKGKVVPVYAPSDLAGGIRALAQRP